MNKDKKTHFDIFDEDGLLVGTIWLKKDKVRIVSDIIGIYCKYILKKKLNVYCSTG